MKDFTLIYSITGHTAEDCIAKIHEADDLGLDTLAFFPEMLDAESRQRVYTALKESNIKNIPLVHLRHDMSGDELLMLARDYGVSYFTIHENHFDVIANWRGFERQLYLEMSTDNQVAPNVNVEAIGGFCVDLAHYKKQAVLHNKDWEYVYDRRGDGDLFVCNHLSGYDPSTNMDMHFVNSENDFAYLAELPPFLFGRLIAFEINNSIADQMLFSNHIVSLLEKKFEFAPSVSEK